MAVFRVLQPLSIVGEKEPPRNIVPSLSNGFYNKYEENTEFNYFYVFINSLLSRNTYSVSFLHLVKVRQTDVITSTLAACCIRVFCIHGSVHHNSILISSKNMQQYAGIYLLQNYFTCFWCPSHPSSEVHKTISAASGTGHITYLKNNLPPSWPN